VGARLLRLQQLLRIHDGGVRAESILRGDQHGRVKPNEFLGLHGHRVEFREISYGWGSLNTGVATLANAYTNLVGVGTTNGFASVSLETMKRNCPKQTSAPRNTVNSVSVQITTADITEDKVTVVLSAPQGMSGDLSVTLNGASSVSLANASVGPGTYNYGFQRTSLAAGEYTSVSANWSAASDAKASASASFDVLGMTRFSTYNALYESTCPGGAPQPHILLRAPAAAHITKVP
jgi:hypothetical protein